MSVKIKIFAIAIAMAISPVTLAQDPIADFATCMADTLDGKQRKEMAKWIYLSMAVHPVLKDYSVATDKDREQTDKSIAALITRLLTEDCPAELAKATNDDPQAIQKGFEFLGQLAMQELMSHSDTMKALSNYVNYLDQEKIVKALQSH